MKYNVEYIFQPSQKEARKPNPPRVPWKIWSKRGDFCRLCTPGYSSLRLEYSLRASAPFGRLSHKLLGNFLEFWQLLEFSITLGFLRFFEATYVLSHIGQFSIDIYSIYSKIQ